MMRRVCERERKKCVGRERREERERERNRGDVFWSELYFLK